jgi:hypothetical protein
MAACIPVKSWLIWLLVKKSLLLKMQQLILGTGTAIWWSTEPHFIAAMTLFIMTLNNVAGFDLNHNIYMKRCTTFDRNAECHYAKRHYLVCHYVKCHYVKCHYVKCHYVKCHYVKCHNVKCHYVKCHYVKCHYNSIVMFSVIITVL